MSHRRRDSVPALRPVVLDRAHVTHSAGVPRVPAQEMGAFGGPLTPADARVVDTGCAELRARPSRLTELAAESPARIAERAKELGLDHTLVGPPLHSAIMKAEAILAGLAFGGGVLEILPSGHGFLRRPAASYVPTRDDIYVAPSQVRRFGLRPGAYVEGEMRPPKPHEAYFALLKIESVDGVPPEVAVERPRFESLPPIYPNRRLELATPGGPIAMRLVDLLCPIGFGQRALIVAPPRTGKTTLLKQLAHAIETNHPNVMVMVVLIDERPEEVTDLRRCVRGEVISSTFDEDRSRHLDVAGIVLDRAHRAVECGRDVVILLDSITRLARACNQDEPHSGRVLSGGMEAGAMMRPKRFFGSARATEAGGSLTVIASALVETGSRMDDVIFEEFKGTGNLEIVLDRRLADRRVFPAIDVHRSGTRNEGLLMSPEDQKRLVVLRRVLADVDALEALDLLTAQMRRTRTNRELLRSISSAGA